MLEQRLDALTDFRKHRSTREVFIAVRAAEIAVLTREQDQLQPIGAVLLPAMGEPKAPVLVHVAPNDEAAIGEVLRDSRRGPGEALAGEQLFNRFPLFGAEDADGTRVGIPEDQPSIGMVRPR